MAKGTFLCYEPWTPSERPDAQGDMTAMELMLKAREITDRYEEAGRQMTVRQIHYQMLSPGYPNSIRSYNRLKDVLNKGRLGGLISWTALEDRGRYLRGLRTYESPTQALNETLDGYRRDLQADQRYHVEAWIEKDAGLGVLADICSELRLNYFACRGYNSQSEMWKAGQRAANFIRKGQQLVVLHIGDHDPSGKDMTRVITERMAQFCGVPVLVVRVALNYNQVLELNLPPNPAKMSDSRAAAYVEEFGQESWELDAIPPDYLHKIVRDAATQFRDQAAWERSITKEVTEQEYLRHLINTSTGTSDEED